MNQLNVKKINHLKFKTSEKLPIVLEEFRQYTSIKKNRKMTTCRNIGISTNYAQKSPQTLDLIPLRTESDMHVVYRETSYIP